MKKRILIILAALTMLLCVPLIANAQIIDNGECGANGGNVTWTLDDEGTLTISGEGNMEDYSYDNPAPWSSIIKVIIEQGVTNIGNCAFYECTSLTNINIPDSVIVIGDYAFDGCISLTNVKLPDSLTSIGNSAFKDCNTLTGIIIPDSVKIIDRIAFENCKSLENITLPDTDIEVYASSFRYCAYFDNDDNWENGILYIGNHLIWADEDVESVTVRNGTKTIADYAFELCRELTGVIISDGVLRIGDSAFLLCTKLEKVTIPDSVAIIDCYAFSNCLNLTEITLPKSIKKIEIDTFSYCRNLKSIFIPAGVTAIRESAFSGCDSLTDIYYEGSEDDWNNIDIDSADMETLLNATIHYNSEMPVKPLEVQPVAPEVNTAANTVSFPVTVTDAKRAAELNEVELYIAEYDANGRLTNVTFGEKGAVNDDTIIITADMPNSEHYKFMLWDGIGVPLMNAVDGVYTRD